MVNLTTEQPVFVVRKYYETGSYIEVQEAFRGRFPNRDPPVKATIWKNVTKYEKSGTSLNLNKGNSGRRRTATSVQNLDAVRVLLENNPNISARRNDSGLSRASFNRITKTDLRWYPYSIKVRHALQENDFRRRLHFSNWFVEQCRNLRFLPNIVISDEAAFAMNGKVNTRNVRQYAPAGNPPPFNFERNASRAKVNVWTGICGNGVLLGPFFIEGNLDGISDYNLLIERVFPPLMANFRDQFDDDHFLRLWWVQDGAPAHTLLMVRDILMEMFQNRVIALHHDIEWPARSPDLTPCDFFLWVILSVRFSLLHLLPSKC